MALRFRLRENVARWEFANKKRLPLDLLAQETGISPQTLSKIADPASEYATSTRHLEALCRFFDVTLNDFVVFDPPLGENRASDPGIKQQSNFAS